MLPRSSGTERQTGTDCTARMRSGKKGLCGLPCVTEYDDESSLMLHLCTGRRIARLRITNSRCL
jgi:hypothetical protein